MATIRKTALTPLQCIAFGAGYFAKLSIGQRAQLYPPRAFRFASANSSLVSAPLR